MRKSRREAKGSMLTKTIIVMVFIAAAVPAIAGCPLGGRY
ncbi:MAG: hypothetical protein QOD64_338, partial [Verrucomicrobiota bacterium]